MKLSVPCALTLLALSSIACSPAAAPTDGEQAGKPDVAKPAEKPVDPTSDVEKDNVNLENLDKPLIDQKK